MNNSSLSLWRKVVVYTMIGLVLFQTTSCHYFKINQKRAEALPTLLEIGEIHKYFIIHQEDQVYALENITVDSTFLNGELVLPTEPIHYYLGRKFRYTKEERPILHEVHIYMTKEASPLEAGSATIPLQDLRELRIIEKDTGKTIASYILVTLGGAAAAFALLLVIVALTKSSCPYVYVYDGEGFVFQGETFGGAIAPNLERDDYMPLPFARSQDGFYHLRINNELKERQYLDLAELLLVHHLPEEQVLLDRNGQPHLLRQPVPPLIAESFSATDVQASLRNHDRDVYFFNEENADDSGLFLTFARPAGITKGKLVLTAKNTLWFDYIFGEFLAKFGGAYPEWMDRQAKIPSDQRQANVIRSEFPLSIYLERDGDWQLVDHLSTVGPLANRDFVVPVDLSDLTADTFRIKIETGFMFWEMDRVAIDFSENPELSVSSIAPAQAIGTYGQDWREALLVADGTYMAQERTGEVTELLFGVPEPPAGQVQSTFLHTRGYYELVRDFTGLPQVDALNRFKEEGHFSEFSRERYRQFHAREEVLVGMEQ